MQSWSDGMILNLLAEGRTIQKRTFKGLATSAGRKAPSLARLFAKRMFQGKCHSAFQLLEEESGSAGVLGEDHTLPSGQTVSEVLRSKHPNAAQMIRESLTPPLQLAMDLAQEKGASSWFTALPLEEHGFTLHKSAFRDALVLRFHQTFHLIVYVVNPYQCSVLSPVREEGFLQSGIMSCVTSLPLFRKKPVMALLLNHPCNKSQVKPLMQPL